MGSPTRFLSVLVVLGAAGAAQAQGERFRLLASDGEATDYFGWACAAGEGVALVGALYHDGGLVNQGAVYVFDAASGAELRELRAADATGGERLGSALAFDGGLALAGAPWDDAPGSQSGSAYVFDVATGAQLFKLVPSDGAAMDHFGGAVALSGDLAIVGAANDDDLGAESGAAYVFDVTTGQQLLKLLPSDGADFDLFGVGVGISGTTAVVGAYLDDDNGSASGSAYVFDVTTGQQLHKLLASDGATLDLFGQSVAISGSRVIVGAEGEDGGAGAAYLFDARTGQERAKLVPSAGGGGSAFGHAVAIDGTTAVVGGYLSSLQGLDAGAAWRFDAATGAEIALMVPEEPGTNRQLGRAVAVGDGTAVLGAPLEGAAGFAAGAAWVFQTGFGPSFCDASDGALASCPCANPGDPATGCDNAQGTGGVALDVLEQQTTTQVATIAATGYPPASAPAAVVIRSGALIAPPALFGDGVRCISSSGLVRLAATTASGGASTHAFGHGAGPGTFHYQVWYRSTPAAYCDPVASFNLSSGVSLSW